MNVLFLTIGSEKTPSTRFRVKQYFPLLERHGVHYRHIPIPHATVKRLRIIPHVRWADVIFLQKKLFSMPELMLLRMAGKPIVFDLDDAIFHEHPLLAESKTGRWHIQRNMKRFAAHVAAADRIIVGSEVLAVDIAALGRSADIVPTPVDTDRFQPGPPRKRTEIVIGWIGTKRNLFYFDMIREALLRLVGQRPGIVIRVVSDGVLEIPGLQVENRRWTETNEVRDIQDFDIGIMPLTDDIYSRGKCSYKLLQYMSCGLPTISSPVGMNSDIITQGINGFLATDDTDWMTYLLTLIDDEGLRQRMGEIARRTVVNSFSVTQTGPRLIALIGETLAQK